MGYAAYIDDSSSFLLVFQNPLHNNLRADQVKKVAFHFAVLYFSSIFTGILSQIKKPKELIHTSFFHNQRQEVNPSHRFLLKSIR